MGSVFGVSNYTVVSGAEGEFDVEGVFDLPKTSAQAWTQGALLYWDNTNKGLHHHCQQSQADRHGGTSRAANPSSTGTVRLNGTFIT